jgi:hypothetical protein
MTRKVLSVFFLTLLIATGNAAEFTNRLSFPNAGFSIAPLDAAPAQVPVQVLMMWLPPGDGFAANVNVQIQPYKGTIEEYVALTLQQMKDAGFKVVQQQVAGKSAAIFECAGEMQKQALHWYARAEQSAGKVYLITATALEQQWAKDAAKLKACVDSFRRDDPADPSPLVQTQAKPGRQDAGPLSRGRGTGRPTPR